MDGEEQRRKKRGCWEAQWRRGMVGSGGREGAHNSRSRRRYGHTAGRRDASVRLCSHRRFPHPRRTETRPPSQSGPRAAPGQLRAVSAAASELLALPLPVCEAAFALMPSRCWGGATVDARQFSICLSKMQTIVGVSLKSGRSGKSPWRMRMVLPHLVAATVDASVALWCNSF